MIVHNWLNRLRNNFQITYRSTASLKRRCRKSTYLGSAEVIEERVLLSSNALKFMGMDEFGDGIYIERTTVDVSEVSQSDSLRTTHFITSFNGQPQELGGNGLTIVLNAAAGMSQQSIDGFQEAADLWASILTDDIVVTIDIDFRALGAGILGQASSTTESMSYANFRTALIEDATSLDDLTATANLPDGPNLSLYTSDPFTGNPVIDNNNSANNSILNINTSLSKAIGVRAAGNTSVDASIAFSSSFTWDFDRSNGISAGAFDFVGVAAHEIGHALGFRSGADTVDVTSGNGPSAPVSLDSFRVFTGLDVFRFSDSSLANGADIDLRADTDVKFFSIDGGATQITTFSTGSFNGDGRQGSHWKDNLSIGIMDPTAAPGEYADITDFDVLAFDVMGWDIRMDFGDAPDTGTGTGANNYATTLFDNGPRHRLFSASGSINDIDGAAKVFLGSGVSSELDGLQDPNANGDTDDGVTVSALIAGQTVDFTVVSTGGVLDYFVDFNMDGDFFDTGESFSQVVTAGTDTVSIVVPEDIVAGMTVARFRISTSGGLFAVGAAADGEVEDYLVTLTNTAETPGITVIETNGDTSVTEGGAADTYTIVLDSQPTDDVTITIAGDTQLNLTPTTLVFTSTDWNVAQEVTVAAVDDYLNEGAHNGTIMHTVTSTDADYDGFAVADITVAITDNDIATPATITVTTAVDEEDGTIDPAVGAGVSLREAILAANSNPDANTIVFAAGLNGTPIILSLAGTDEDGGLTGDLDITEDITITGNGIAQTVIDADDIDRVFHLVNGASINIEALTITGGSSSSGGGILVTDNAMLSLTGSEVRNNMASSSGGGIAATIGGEIILTESTISNNTAGQSGGGISTTGEFTIDRSTISGNSSASSGGGMYVFRSSTVSGVILQSTFSNNSSNTGGGGLFNFDKTISIDHSTFTGNRADADEGFFSGTGGGIGSFGVNGVIDLNNTIVAGNFVGTGNTSDDITTGDIIAASSFNLIGDSGSAGGLMDGVNGNIVGVNGVGIRDINTILNTNLVNNGGPTLTHSLLAGSAAIDAGDPAFATPPNTDQRGTGFNRVVNARIDIGALEEDAPQTPPTLTQFFFGRFEHVIDVGQMQATDPDQPDNTLVYSISGNGADDALFSITSDGLLSFNLTPDFENPVDSDGDNVYEVSVQVTDNTSLTDTETQFITINDAVDNIIPGGVIAMLENSTIEFSNSKGNVIELDSPSSFTEYTVNLTVPRGILTLATTAGLISETGNNSGMIQITGTAPAINAALDGLMYTADAQLGPISLTIDTSTSAFGQFIQDIDQQQIEIVDAFVDSALDYTTFNGMDSFSTTNRSVIFGDDLVEIDPTASYTISGNAFSGDGMGGLYNPNNRQYFGFASYDADMLRIDPWYVTQYAGSSQARLARQLKTGDTVIYLDNVSGWNNGGPSYSRALAWYGYANSAGEVYDDYTYTRNVIIDAVNGAWDPGQINYTNNSITLRTPWAGPNLQANTAFTNNTSSSTFNYNVLSGQSVTNQPQQYTGSVAGLGNQANQFRHGTAFIRSLILTNYQTGPMNQINWSNVQIDRTVEEYLPGETVELRSIQDSTATYQWTQTGGPQIQLNNDDQYIANFVAPVTNVDITLDFEVTIDNGTGMTTNTISVIILANTFQSDSLTDSALDYTTFGGEETFSTIRRSIVFGDDFISVDLNDEYVLSGSAFSNDPANSINRQYLGFVSFDADHLEIKPWYVTPFAGSSQARLTQELRNGDTVIQLDNVSGWNNGGPGYARTLAWYGYANSSNFVYDDYTYTRNVLLDSKNGAWDAGQIDYVNNTITLRNAWTGGTISSGTAFTNNTSGGTYNYNALSYGVVPGEVTEFSGTISGIGNQANQFRHGTSFIKTLLLTNYGPSNQSAPRNQPPHEITWSNIEIDRVSEFYRPLERVDLKVTKINNAIYRWRQVSGPNVALENTDEFKTSFLTPTSNQNLTFVFDVDIILDDKIDTEQLTVSLVGLN